MCGRIAVVAWVKVLNEVDSLRSEVHTVPPDPRLKRYFQTLRLPLRPDLRMMKSILYPHLLAYKQGDAWDDMTISFFRKIVSCYPTISMVN